MNFFSTAANSELTAVSLSVFPSRISSRIWRGMEWFFENTSMILRADPAVLSWRRKRPPQIYVQTNERVLNSYKPLGALRDPPSHAKRIPSRWATRGHSWYRFSPPVVKILHKTHRYQSISLINKQRQSGLFYGINRSALMPVPWTCYGNDTITPFEGNWPLHYRLSSTYKFNTKSTLISSFLVTQWRERPIKECQIMTSLRRVPSEVSRRNSQRTADVDLGKCGCGARQMTAAKSARDVQGKRPSPFRPRN